MDKQCFDEEICNRGGAGACHFWCRDHVSRICFYYLFHLIFCSLSTDYYKYSRLWSKTDGSSMFQWRNICRGGVGDCIYWCRDHGYYYGGCFAEACCCQI
ncbi:hypothetical protein HID58_022047 [Brassica napus]|uniref:Uncharacterized protein n=1 Tax=Brassica napus TaxID=3708 RepID=A0ABQ8CY66_BRANA|nr:hypothetical protein HID58_022047 [Brassica napus]